jgi:enoyl-CoA hydratase
VAYIAFEAAASSVLLILESEAKVADYETVMYEPGPVARVILNRPERHNAQSWTLLSEMEAAFNEAVTDPECRIIVLSGGGRSFSAGHDLDSPQQVESRRARVAGLDPFASTGASHDVYVNSHLRWRDLPKPTVAMVHGYCIFGGWMIASAMDFIFAAEDALFIPVFGDYFTASWDIGPRKAKEVLYENKFITAREAMDWGFVNRVYPAADLEAETLKYANRVAEHDPFTTRTVKFQINQTMDGMGFTQSVRAVGASFIRRPPRPRSESADTPQSRDEAPMRSQVTRASRYLQEDRAATDPMA